MVTLWCFFQADEVAGVAGDAGVPRVWQALGKGLEICLPFGQGRGPCVTRRKLSLASVAPPEATCCSPFRRGDRDPAQQHSGAGGPSRCCGCPPILPLAPKW